MMLNNRMFAVTFPSGFLGTNADLLVDIVTCSLVLFIPALWISYRKTKKGDYLMHRNLQVFMAAILAMIVIIFEWDIRSSGGIFKMTEGSRWAGTLFLKASFYIHLFFSGITSAIWLLIIPLSLLKFGNPPTPSSNSFRRIHRFGGRAGMLGAILTALSGIEIYVIGFVI